MPGWVHGNGQAVRLYRLGQLPRPVQHVPPVLGGPHPLLHAPLPLLLPGLRQGRGDREGPAEQHGVGECGDGVGVPRSVRPGIPAGLPDRGEPTRTLLEPQRFPVPGQVVDVDVLAGHVGQELRAVGREGDEGGGDRGHTALAHGVKVGARIGDVSRAEVGEEAGHGSLLDLPDRAGEPHDPPVVETDVGVEGADGHLLRADGVGGEALALGAGGVGVAAWLQVQQHVAAGAVPAAAVGLSGVQLSAKREREGEGEGEREGEGEGEAERERERGGRERGERERERERERGRGRERASTSHTSREKLLVEL